MEREIHQICAYFLVFAQDMRLELTVHESEPYPRFPVLVNVFLIGRVGIVLLEDENNSALPYSIYSGRIAVLRVPICCETMSLNPTPWNLRLIVFVGDAIVHIPHLTMHSEIWLGRKTWEVTRTWNCDTRREILEQHPEWEVHGKVKRYKRSGLARCKESTWC